MSSLLPLALVLIVLGITLYPLFARRLGSARLVRTGRLAQLRDRYQATLADLQDIELDREVGNLSEGDYAPLRERYRRQAAVLLRQLDVEEAQETAWRAALSPNTAVLGRQSSTRNGRNGALSTEPSGFSLSWGLALGTVLAVLASVGVVSLYLRQAQQQAAQAPLAQLSITRPQAIAIDSDGYWVAYAGGLLHSTDGKTWNPASPDVSFSRGDGSLATLPQPTGPMLFMVRDGSVVRSTDAGRTWAAAAGAGNLALNGFVQAIAADPDRNTVYAATDRGLFFTNALGTQWIQLPFHGGAAAIGVQGDQLAVVDSDGRFFLSRSGGATWQN